MVMLMTKQAAPPFTAGLLRAARAAKAGSSGKAQTAAIASPAAAAAAIEAAAVTVLHVYIGTCFMVLDT